MVSPGDALPHRAHEEDCPLNARTPRTDSQLFPRSKVALQRRRRGSEQQSQSHYEKILRLPNVPLPRTRALSLTWQITGAGINPRFFLTNLFYNALISFRPISGLLRTTAREKPRRSPRFLPGASDPSASRLRLPAPFRFRVSAMQCSKSHDRLNR